MKKYAKWNRAQKLKKKITQYSTEDFYGHAHEVIQTPFKFYSLLYNSYL